MKLTIITLLIAVISVLEIARTLRRTRQDQLGVRPAVIWMGLWVGIGFFALFPNLLQTAVNLAQMEDRPFFITVVGLLVLFTLVFDQVTKTEKLRRDIVRLAQDNALLRARQTRDLTEKEGDNDGDSGSATP
jgi:hypothetical protein